MITLAPIGFVRSTRTKMEGDNWDVENIPVELDQSQFSPGAFAGLAAFSHVEIVFYMDQVDPAKIETTIRHPRNNPGWPSVGIFAQRGKNRPNRIGTTICRILKIDGLDLYLEGLDAMDGSPVLYAATARPSPVRLAPAWPLEAC